MRINILSALLLLAMVSSVAIADDEARYDIRRFGAVPGQKTLATAAIQKAIDQCAADGGGVVYIGPGSFVSGGLVLKSNVTLEIEAGATLLGSTDPKDYPERVLALGPNAHKVVRQALIWGENLQRVAIRGRGTIDGQGKAFPWDDTRNRPLVILLFQCRDVFVEGVHLRNSAAWMQHYIACEHTVVRGISVWNHAAHNNDGIDLDSCRDAVVSDCLFEADDDALCLKSMLDQPCENITIANCICRSHCNAIKMGTGSNGGFQNVTITNCTIESPRGTKPINGWPRGTSGISLEIVNGGRLDGVAISNIAIRGVFVPLFMRLGNRAKHFAEDGPKPGVGSFRNVVVNNIVATGMSTIGCSIAGIPGHAIENVSLSNLNFTFEGGAAKDTCSRNVPECEPKYPECLMFGTLPAYGFYCRHVNGIRFSNVRLATDQPDPRPALLADDVKNLVADGFEAAGSPGAASLVRLRQVESGLLRGWIVRGAPAAFLRMEGSSTRRIVVGEGDTGSAAKLVDSAAEVPSDALLRK